MKVVPKHRDSGSVCPCKRYLIAGMYISNLSQRAAQKSTIITSNLTFERWDEVFGDAALTSALVDRLTYKAILIDMEGDSYRLRETLRTNDLNMEQTKEDTVNAL
ncbi:MAG: ATP-binding protein [Lachnospiraceae bacterium]